jgi:hypothetical protein
MAATFFLMSSPFLHLPRISGMLWLPQNVHFQGLTPLPINPGYQMLRPPLFFKKDKKTTCPMSRAGPYRFEYPPCQENRTVPFYSHGLPVNKNQALRYPMLCFA